MKMQEFKYDTFNIICPYLPSSNVEEELNADHAELT
jgi:hypothetical protein